MGVMDVGRVLKVILEGLVIVVLAIVALIAGLMNPEKINEFKKKQKGHVDSFEKDLHDKYAEDEISDIQFSEGLDRVANAKNKVK